MMYIEVSTPNANNYIGTGNLNLSWHVGTPLPLLKYGDMVISIQADGDELEYIRSRFENLPDVPKKRVVQWYGDIARFIYSGLITGGHNGRKQSDREV